MTVKVEIKITHERGEVTIVQHSTKVLGSIEPRPPADVLTAAVADAKSWLRRNPPPRGNGARSERRG